MALSMTTASRTSGVAPLDVHFDCVDVDGEWTSGVIQPPLVAGRRDFADEWYRWDFGDYRAPRWTKTDGGDANKARGHQARHVYTRPGTYTVRLRTITASDIVVEYEQTITVTDPDTVFAGNTFYVDSVAGDDGNPGTLAEPFETFATAMAEATAACRILFKRGGTYPTTTTGDITAAGPGSIGAYSTGADPIITQATAGESGFELTDDAADWRICDLVITGPGVTSTGKGIFNAHDTLLCYNLTISGFKQAFYANYDVFPGSVYDADLEHDHVCFADCDFSNNGVGGSGSNGVWWGGNRFALLGCYCDAISGEHHVRLWHARKSVILHSELTNANTGKQAIKLHNHYTITGLPDGQYNIIADGLFSGGSTTLPIGPQSSSYDETVRDTIVERCMFIASADTATFIRAGGPYIVARNNVFVDLLYAYASTGVWIGKDTNGPSAVGCRAYNNTMYGNGTYDKICVRLAEGSDLVAANNLACNIGSGDGDAVLVGAGTGTVMTNLDDYDPAYFADPSSYDFHLVLNSPAINAGTTYPACRDDRDMTRRPQNNATDIGAYEYIIPPRRGRKQAINIRVPIGTDWDSGSRVQVYTDQGMGTVDSASPMLPRAREAFPGRSQVLGHGEGLLGNFRCGSLLPALPRNGGYGDHQHAQVACGLAQPFIEVRVMVPADFGVWTFAAEAVDAEGNVQSGGLVEIERLVSGLEPFPLDQCVFRDYQPEGDAVTIAVSDEI